MKRKTLRVFNLYKRFCKGVNLPLNQEALQDFYLYESKGILPKSIHNFTEFTKTNGFAYGKWQAKLTVEMIQEDVRKGLFSKAEFANTSHLKSIGLPVDWFQFDRNNWFIFPQLKHVVAEPVY